MYFNYCVVPSILKITNSWLLHSDICVCVCVCVCIIAATIEHDVNCFLCDKRPRLFEVYSAQRIGCRRADVRRVGVLYSYVSCTSRYRVNAYEARVTRRRQLARCES